MKVEQRWLRLGKIRTECTNDGVENKLGRAFARCVVCGISETICWMSNLIFENSLLVQESARKVTKSIAMCDFTSGQGNVLLSFPSCGAACSKLLLSSDVRRSSLARFFYRPTDRESGFLWRRKLFALWSTFRAYSHATYSMELTHTKLLTSCYCFFC